MCRHVHVKLTEAEQQAVRKIYGVMVPVFASLVLLLVGAMTLKVMPRSGEVLTAAATSTPQAGPTARAAP